MSDLQYESSGILEQKKYLLLACHVLWREFSQVAAQSPHEIFPVFLKQGLHNEPDNLRKQVQEQIDEADKIAQEKREDLGNDMPYDAILLGYGLCSNGIAGLKSKYHKIIVPRAHDCITLFLGDKNKYRQYFDDHPGIYWYCGGWIATGTMPGEDRIETLRRIYTEKYEDEDTVEYLISEEKRWMDEYSQACFIKQNDLEISAPEKKSWQNYTKKCADYCGWKYSELDGNLEIIKNLVNGNWQTEDFLIVPPEHAIQPSFDDTIISSVKDELKDD